MMQENGVDEKLWEKHYHIGVENIDNQHDKLFSIARRIVSIRDESAHNQFRRTFVGKEGIKFLKSYALNHFADEEAYMKEIGYPHFTAHKQEHDKFRDVVVPSLEHNLIESDYSQDAVERLVAAVLAWLVNHISKTDMDIVGRAAVPLRSEVESDRIEETMANIIINLFSGMFDLNMRVADLHYGGEDFGDAIFYERSYQSPETKQKVQFITALGGNASAFLGEMLLNQPDAVMDHMIASLIEEFSFMLIQHLDHMLIKEEHSCRYAEGSFIDREKFEQILQNKMPEFSILFETDKGKFAVCADRIPLM